MRTIPVTLRDILNLGLGGETWQSFVDRYEEKYNAVTVEGFEFDPISINYTFQQLLSKVGATVLPTYVDPESEGYEMPLGQAEGVSGNIPTQKLFYSVNRVVVREQMQLAQAVGKSALNDNMRDVMFKLLDEGTEGIYQAFINALNHQRHQVVSNLEFTINATNNPRGYRGVTIGFGAKAYQKDALSGTSRWWTNEGHTTEGSASDPIAYMKERVKFIRKDPRTHYSGGLRLEISQDLWDDLLNHSKVKAALASYFYPNAASAAVALDSIKYYDEDAFKEAIRKMIKVDEIKVQETYAYVSKPTTVDGVVELVSERIDNFNPKNIAFVPTGKLGGIQGVQPLSMGYDANDIAYALGNRLLIEQEAIPRTHSINVNGEMAQLCVPSAIYQMFVSTVTA